MISTWKVIRIIAFILSSLLLGFFGLFIVGEGFFYLSNVSPKLTSTEIIMFVFLGTSFLGFIIVYFKQALGALLSMTGAIAFIITESIGNSAIWSLSKGWPFYLIFFAGLLHLLASKLQQSEKKNEHLQED